MTTRHGPETSIEHYITTLQPGMLALRSFRLHERSKSAYSRGQNVRGDMLRNMSAAYAAGGMALEHRLHKSPSGDALLEMVYTHLAAAREPPASCANADRPCGACGNDGEFPGCPF